MSRIISRAESWETVYEAFNQINFSAFDYNTIKESLLDYLKLYFPEDFSDYIESSELIAILEMFAYMGEQLSYRLDVNAHENFITQAQRKDSILRLAKLLSYNPSRNLPARGLVKITSIQTSETLIDSAGRNLANKKIIWDDINNVNWKEQFLLVMNRVLEQEFGTVTPTERVQVENVLFEIYSWNNNSLSTTGKTVFPYNTSTASESFPMELVPVSLTPTGPEEKRPEENAKFTILYGSDGLGDASDTTGFFLYTKQGTLNKQILSFDGVTPNQTVDIPTTNINETDVWLNNVNPDTGELFAENPNTDILPHLASDTARHGEWVEVDLAHAQNIIFNTNKNRHKYEIETLDEDRIRIIFGDGEFSDIPKGTFHAWFRTSNNSNTLIPKTSIVNQSASFGYEGITGINQTLSFSFSLVNSLQNGASSEDVEHVRRTAPAVYYTQDRMVNGRDYNEFPLQDPSILKMRAINRTFTGDSKYMAWHDPRENYEDVKMFGDDLAVYWIEQPPASGGLVSTTTTLTSEKLISNIIEPILCGTDFFSVIGPHLIAAGLNPGNIRCVFSTTPLSFDPASTEKSAIKASLDAAPLTTPTVILYYSIAFDEWTVNIHPNDPASIEMFSIDAKFDTNSIFSHWDVHWRTRRLVAQSSNMKFWNTNTTDVVTNFDTLNATQDKIVILKANPNASETGLLENDLNYNIVGQELLESVTNHGLPDVHRLSIMPVDTNEDSVPDNLAQKDLLDATQSVPYTPVITLASPILVTPSPNNDLVVVSLDGSTSSTQLTYDMSGLAADSWNYGSVVDSHGTTININNLSGPSTDINITVVDYVYLSRETTEDTWVPQQGTLVEKLRFLAEYSTPESDKKHTRYPGRFPLNFAWMHFNTRLNLIDPSPTNIIDFYITTTSYYSALQGYLANRTAIAPTPPTSLDLRTSYKDMLDNRMISDGVIMHPGKFKVLFGPRAVPQLQARLQIVRSATGTNLTDNEVKVRAVTAIRSFFDISDWEFGETFFFTELMSVIHTTMGSEIDSIVIVPVFPQNVFGDLFQVNSREDELFIPDINTSDIDIVSSISADQTRIG